MDTSAPKPIRLSAHALEQCIERRGSRRPAKFGRWWYRYNMPFNREWNGTHYAIKQVAPIVAENPTEFVVVTVYTFFF